MTRRGNPDAVAEPASPVCFAAEADADYMWARPQGADIQLKRIQDPASHEDGLRVLVDRLWPRGISKAQARIDHWAKEVAPSPALRKWFGHDPEKFAEFARRYRAELADRDDQLEPLLREARAGRLTLLFAARDREHNHAVVLAEVLRERV